MSYAIISYELEWQCELVKHLSEQNKWLKLFQLLCSNKMPLETKVLVLTTVF